MSRGRKAKAISSGSTWKEIFSKSQGFYFQYIAQQLGRKNRSISNEDAIDLLESINKEKEPSFKQKHISLVKSEEVRLHAETLFKLPKNWIWCKLEEIGEAVIGLTYKPSQVNENGTPVLRANNVQDNKIHYEDLVKVNADVREKQFANIGDIVICVRSGSANLIGKSAIIDREGYSFGAFMSLVRSPINDYVQLFMTSNLCKDQINDKKSTGINQLTQATLRNLSMPLPPRTEQRMILEFLRGLEENSLEEGRVYFDSEIEKEIVSIHQGQIHHADITAELSRQLELVSQLRQAFLREAMQGKLVPQDESEEPAAVLLEKIKAEKETLIAEKKIKREKPLPEITPEEIPFEIPNNWTWCRLGEIAHNVEYGTSQKADLNSSNVPVLRMNNIFEGKVVMDNLKYVKPTIKELPRLYLQNGDLLFNRTNSYELVGKSGVFRGANDTTTFASYLIRIQFSDSVSEDFVNHYINSIQCRETQIEPDIIQQNGQANFNGTKLQKIIAPLPPLAEQKRIVEKLEKLMKLCDELEANIRESATRAETLLQVALKEALEPVK